MAIVVGGIWHGWSAGTINGGAAGSIGNHHAVAKEAGNHMDIWSFAATCAGAGEFKIRWLILRPLQCAWAEWIFLRWQGDGIIPVFLLFNLCIDWFHNQRFFTGWADISTESAAYTVFLAYNNAVFESLYRTAEVFHNKPFRCVSRFVFRYQERADSCMRADYGALITADTVFWNPFR